MTINSLTASDSVIIPLQCEYYAMEGLSQLLKTIRLIKHHLNPGLEIEGILLTMFDVRNNLSHQVAEEVQSHFRGMDQRACIAAGELANFTRAGQPPKTLEALTQIAFSTV